LLRLPPVGEQRINWLKGSAIGCGVLLAFPLLAVIVVSLRTWVPLRASAKSLAHLEERFGAQDAYVPAADGAIPGPRLLAFLDVRRSLVGLCDEFDAAQGTFHSVDALDAEELPSAREVAGTTRGFAGTAVEISPLIGRFFKQRNLALLEAGIGLGEYSYIYALAYLEQLLDESIEEPLFAQGGPISPEACEVLRAILAHQVDSLGEGADTDTRRRELDAEILAMERDPQRPPWRNGLPQAVEASLEPYREQLDAAFCLSNAGIEMDPDSRRALYIALY
jgi:hypothetical protein